MAIRTYVEALAEARRRARLKGRPVSRRDVRSITAGFADVAGQREAASARLKLKERELAEQEQARVEAMALEQRKVEEQERARSEQEKIERERLAETQRQADAQMQQQQSELQQRQVEALKEQESREAAQQLEQARIAEARQQAEQQLAQRRREAQQMQTAQSKQAGATVGAVAGYALAPKIGAAIGTAVGGPLGSAIGAVVGSVAGPVFSRFCTADKACSPELFDKHTDRYLSRFEQWVKNTYPGWYRFYLESAHVALSRMAKKLGTAGMRELLSEIHPGMVIATVEYVRNMDMESAFENYKKSVLPVVLQYAPEFGKRAERLDNG